MNRHDFDQSVSRKHFLSTQDIRNVKRSLQELQQELFNPVLLYKSQGNASDQYSSLKIESFILALQTQFQIDLYQKFSKKILYIDATHGTNAYKFKLITCLVWDEFS